MLVCNHVSTIYFYIYVNILMYANQLTELGMSDIGFFADIRYAILSNSKFSIPISADTDVDIWVIFPQT